ncbi:hypothetical protein [Dactylosporangium siamense]|uniref:Uncharacterized protein n=1 Tax=Dactylosporangium siamense TaxID=685454 RepID=A0A919UIF1_9ACTN|nr:hypothetical protein Dsi01nite_106110 [Dactylosporangium siamense]
MSALLLCWGAGRRGDDCTQGGAGPGEIGHARVQFGQLCPEVVKDAWLQLAGVADEAGHQFLDDPSWQSGGE